MSLTGTKPAKSIPRKMLEVQRASDVNYEIIGAIKFITIKDEAQESPRRRNMQGI